MKILNTIKAKALGVKNRFEEMKRRIAVKAMNLSSEIASNEGANTHTDVTVWIVIGITLGAIALALLIYIFKDVVMEKVEEMINSMFGKA